MNKCPYTYPAIYGGCPAECPKCLYCPHYDGGDIVIITRRDCFGDDTQIHALRTPAVDLLSIYDSEGYYLYEILRYRCSGNYYIRTRAGNLEPLLMRSLYSKWKITEVFGNG